MEGESEYELVMPFISCASRGGPYDDDAFVAGFQTGAVDALLAAGLTPPPGRPYYKVLLPQLDLIAMRYGRTVTVVGYQAEDDVVAAPKGGGSEWEWVNLTFSESRL